MKRGIYLLPTLFTVGNLLCGFAAVVLTSRSQTSIAALLILIGAVLDGLDGRIARLTGTTSDFGVEFDSLADIVSFGVAPAFLVFHWGLEPFGRLGWAIAFLYVVCAAMRLARFNIQKSREEKRFFAGLPSPPAAVSLAALVYMFPAPGEWLWLRVPIALGTTIVALLMVSRFRYRSFKEFDLRNRRSYIYVLPVVAVIMAIVARPAISWLSLTAIYVFSGPALYAWSLLRRNRIAVPPEVFDESIR